MAIPDWTVDLLKKQISDVAEQLKQPEAIDQLRHRASEFLQEIPQTASRLIDQARESFPNFASLRGAAFRPGTSVLNASGCYLDPAVASTPLSTAALEALLAGCSHFMAQGDDDGKHDRQIRQRCAAAVGADALQVVGDWSTVLVWLADLAESRGGRCFVPRGSAELLDGTQCAADGLHQAGATVIEIGTRAGVPESLWEEQKIGEADLLVVDSTWKKNELPAAARDATLVQLLPQAVLHWANDQDAGSAPPSVAASLRNEADIVAVGTAGWIGGPPACAVFTRPPLIEAIRWFSEVDSCQPWYRSSVLAALDAAGRRESPLDFFLATSIENLQNRAQNLATRLAPARVEEGGVIESLEVTHEPAWLDAEHKHQVASRQLRLRHRDWSVSQWQKQLREQTPAILAAAIEDALVVDLRYLEAAHDAELAAALGADLPMPKAGP